MDKKNQETLKAYTYIIKTLIPILNKANIKLMLDFDNNAVYTNDIGCSGYFDYEEKTLVAAVGNKDLRDWFSTLLHEFSHFEQWKENCPAWENSQRLKNSDYILDEWLIGKKDYNNIDNIFKDIAYLEYDCEIRTTEKLKEFPNIIDQGTYIQKSNAYIAFYKQALNKRKWYNPEKAPYLNEKIWKEMPSEFLHFKYYWDDYQFDYIDWGECL